MHALVICVGNEARGDDGSARHVARLLEGRVPMSTVVLSEPQLDLAMAEDVAKADVILFVDAQRREDPPVEVTPVLPSEEPFRGHAPAPGTLLSIATNLFGRAGTAHLVSIASPHMEHGVGLSKTAEAASTEAASEVIRRLSSPGD